MFWFLVINILLTIAYYIQTSHDDYNNDKEGKKIIGTRIIKYKENIDEKRNGTKLVI